MMIAIVVSFIPPPVEPGAAPMNIKSIENTFIIGDIPSISIELKPAVRSVADWKKLFPSL